jgi:hypothetical protein
MSQPKLHIFNAYFGLSTRSQEFCADCDAFWAPGRGLFFIEKPGHPTIELRVDREVDAIQVCLTYV